MLKPRHGHNIRYFMYCRGDARPAVLRKDFIFDRYQVGMSCIY
jgi:indole-3-glycerol phosphate synthase